ncbi:MAG: hypothetical protein R2752_11610 [Vicinamibacterales bacterium]
MPRLQWRLGFASLLSLVLAAGVSGQQAADVRSADTGVASPAPPDGPGIEALTGLWDYNATESLNVATGRPEQDPAAARRSTPGAMPGQPAPGRGRGPSPGAVPSGGYGGSGSGGNGPGGAGFGGGFGADDPAREQAIRYRQMLASENRALLRDLMEVPETLDIQSSDASVTLTDDLDRSLTFPTDRTKRKYHLSASDFEASAWWDGRQLIKDIEGARGFRMSETYYLSQDGRRLFVIVRLGQGKPDEPVVGANRVYDRIERSTGPGRTR